MKNLSFVIIVLLAFAWTPTALAQTNIFIGPVTGNWNDAGNWDLNRTPISTDDVFMGGTSTFSNVTNSFTINSLSIADSSNVGSGVVVTGPAGNVNNTGATTIGSGSSGTSYLQLNNAVAVVSTASMDLTGDGNTQIRFAAGTINVGGGSGSITDTGAGTSALRIQGTSVTINAANVTLDQMIYGANNASGTLAISSGQTYNMNEAVYFGQATTLNAGTTFTLNLSGGTLNAPVVSLNHANTANAASVVNLSSGRLTSGLIQRTRDGTSQTFNWTGGTIANTAGGNLVLGRGGNATQNLVLTLTGSGNQTFEAETGRSITVAGTANLAGNGTLTKTGGGNLIINSASTFTGGTTLTAGTITLGNASALSTGPVTVNAGTLDLNGLNVTLTRLSGAGGAITLGGGNLTINSTVAAATLASSISGAGSVTKTGGAVLTLAGNSTYTGDTFLQTSGIQLGVDDALPTGTVFHFTNSGASRLQLMGFDQTLGGLDSTAATGGTIVEAAPDFVNNAAATLTLDVASGSYNYTASLRDAPSSTDSALTLVKNGAGTQVLSGGVAVTYSGTTTINGGVLEFASANNVVNNSAIALGGGTVRFSGGGTRSSTIAGSGNLEKTGANTLTLSGNNTYTGTTTVSAGSLIIGATGSVGGSSVLDVASGATLDVSAVTGGFVVGGSQTLRGSGTIVGNTTINGIHSPGNSAGVQTFASDLTYSGTPTVQWELTANTTTQASPTPVFDQIVVNGNLDFAVATTLTLNFALAESAVDWSNGLWANDITGASGWLVYDVAGSLSNFQNLSVSVENWADGDGVLLQSVRAGSSFSLYNDGISSDVYLNYAVPEPSTYALLALAAAGLGAHVVRRRRSAR